MGENYASPVILKDVNGNHITTHVSKIVKSGNVDFGINEKNLTELVNRKNNTLYTFGIFDGVSIRSRTEGN